MEKFKNKDVAKIFNGYPKRLRENVLFLRQLIFDVASEMADVDGVEETIKWGQPSYIAKGGTTIRIDVRDLSLDQYAMYFHCGTKLIGTFREVYKEEFNYEGNRAIIFTKDKKIPVEELKHCIALSLTYHSRKKLPMLGISDAC